MPFRIQKATLSSTDVDLGVYVSVYVSVLYSSLTTTHYEKVWWLVEFNDLLTCRPGDCSLFMQSNNHVDLVSSCGVKEALISKVCLSESAVSLYIVLCFSLTMTCILNACNDHRHCLSFGVVDSSIDHRDHSSLHNNRR